MEVVILDSGEQLAALAADAVERLLADKPDAVLGLATGSSPLSLYNELVRRHQAGRVSFSRARAFMLDEYVGLAPDHPQRYRNVIEREIAARVDFGPGAVAGPDGNAVDLAAACRAYDQAIRDAGGVDLQILGVGADGHIAFNEPGSSLASRTRIKTLTRQTVADNARFFDGDQSAVPRHVVTQGLATIMEARHLVLTALGRPKAEAVHQMVEGAVSALWPASILQFHPHATVLLDRDAASRLQLASYYEHVYSGKPAWQGL
ncbi:MAG: glucosamine-6-phosphate deaminase [Bifidobacteriaceae bacterium]|jgi:glucosamine-6-phosphate deaminase|nr:glucosamine-6-phosphate deaminase [Bifidobacteriaceae bacterium]